MQRNWRKRINGFIAIVFATSLIFSLFLSIKAIAEGAIFEIQSAEITEMSASASGAIGGYSDSTITSNVIFHKIGDSATYKVTLKNSDGEDHVIKTISDNNANSNISYLYDKHENETVAAGSIFDFVFTAKYATGASIDNRSQAAEVKFVIQFADTDESEEIIITPDTNDNLGVSLLILAISAAGFIACVIIFVKNRKAMRGIVAIITFAFAAVATVSSVQAAAIKIDCFNLTTSYGLYDKLIIKIGDEDIVVDYSEKLEDVSGIVAPAETGYTFVGWQDEGGNDIDVTAPITDDIVIVPKYEAHKFTVRFNRNGATGGEDMANQVVTYGETTTLNPNAYERPHYEFIGWATSADGAKVYDDKADITNAISENNGVLDLYAAWQEVTATLETGQNINSALKTLAKGSTAHYNNTDKIIKNLEFVDTLPNTVDENTPKANIALDGGIPVYAYWVASEEKIYINTEANRIYANTNSDRMFYGIQSLASLTLPASLDTSNVTDMSYMFAGMITITSLTLPDSFNTSSVTNMSHMFHNMSALTSLTFSNSFDTSNVTDMSYMFSSISKLTSLSLPNSFNTSSVTNMRSMFSAMYRLTSLTLPDSFNTSSVTNMSYMFYTSFSLTSLSLPNSFNTSNVTDMSYMFFGISWLTSLSLPNSFDTSNVTDMSNMFGGMNALTMLTLPDSFNTSNVTNMSKMFDGMYALTSLSFSANFNTSKVTNMEGMFRDIRALTSLTLPTSFNTSSVTNMNSMFSGMRKLTSLTLPNNFMITSNTTTTDIFISIPTTATLYAADAKTQSLWPGVLGN